MQRPTILNWLAIALFAQLGALLRLTLALLAGVDDHQRSSTLYSNFLGCMIIAIVNTSKPRFDELDLLPIFNGISAGFCGALTTFSSWNMEIVRWLVMWPTPSMLGMVDNIHHFSAFSAVLTELAVSCLGFQIGHLCAESMREAMPSSDPQAAAVLRGDTLESQPLMRSGPNVYGTTVALPGRDSEWRLALQYRTGCDYMHGGQDAQEDGALTEKKEYTRPLMSHMCCFAAVGCTVVAYSFILPAAKRQGLTFILSFAPLGALLRYYLGLWFNAWPQHFKVGTFMANFGACLVLGICTVFKAREHCFAPGASNFGPWWNELLLGVTFGFCGALSTMSTLVAQMFEMHIVYGFAYFCVSLLASQALLAAILGIFLFSSGVTTVCA
mmetsp:Transcript_10826/g.27024  ORF Transcript_10826/g.27024 Transcript_10826/m.27024 type:complete len:384 (+) Transcript_10826:80-1231(+)